MSSQLASIATLFKKLETTLDSSGTHDSTGQDVEGEGIRGRGEDSDTDSPTPPPLAPPPDLVVLAPPGTKPLRGRMLSQHDPDMSVVYSRSSSQLLLSGRSPDPSLVVLKDSTHRCAEVSVVRPSETTSGFRWTRAGIRAIRSANHPNVRYLEESDTSSDDFSSSDSDNGVFEPVVEGKKKKKKRVRCKPPQGSRFNHGKRVSGIVALVSSAEEESVEGDYYWEGSVQMECEVGGEHFETQSPMLSLQCTSANTPPPTAPASIPHASHVNIFTVYEDLKLPQPNKELRSDPIREKARASVEGSVRRRKQLQPFTVRVTRLPHHIIDQHLLPTKIKKSTAVEAAAAGSMCSDESSTSSSESVSLLRPQSRDLFSQSESKNTQRTSMQPSSPSLTPRRLGDGGRGPVARRSIPFSKAPRTPAGPTTDKPSHTTSLDSPLVPANTTKTTSSESSQVPATKAKSSHTTPSQSSLLPTKSPLKPLHLKPSSVRSSPSTSARSSPTTPCSTKPPLAVPVKGSSGVKAVAVGWSSDEDFEATPGPSFVLSPNTSSPGVGRKSLVKKKKSEEVASSLLTESMSAVSSSSGGSKSSSLPQSSVTALVRGRKGGEELRDSTVVMHEKTLTSKDLPVKTEAHSASEDKSALDNGTLG